MGAEAGGRGWSQVAGHFPAGHAGPAEKDAQGGPEPVEALPPTHRPVMDTAGGGAGSDDFVGLLRRMGPIGPIVPMGGTPRSDVPLTQATTILAFKFLGGVLVAGDRRATAGNTVVYDRADKVLQIDRHSIMAIAGVPATAWEMARVLEHSFQYFRRTQLQEMSVDGKVRALSKLLRDNFGLALQGLGMVVPIFATYDSDTKPEGRLYFYDAMGAQFEATDFAATGSGSPAVRGILYYENTWGKRPLQKISQDEAVVVALRALDTASEG